MSAAEFITAYHQEFKRKKNQAVSKLAELEKTITNQAEQLVKMQEQLLHMQQQIEQQHRLITQLSAQNPIDAQEPGQPPVVSNRNFFFYEQQVRQQPDASHNASNITPQLK